MNTCICIMNLIFAGVGKTSLVHLICHNEPNTNPGYTIGCSVEVKVSKYRSTCHTCNLYCTYNSIQLTSTNVLFEI